LSWRSSLTSPDPERLVIGRVLGAKGLDGALRVEPLTDWPERLGEGATVYLEGEASPRRVVAAEPGGRLPVLRLAGIEGRQAAEALTGRFLESPARELPADTYYWHELVGLKVIDAGGAEVGTLAEVFRAGGSEVYRVVGPSGERLVPALRRVVRRIDLSAGVMELEAEADDAEEVR
jgi:16S rRNA processing protein RimM